MIKINNSHSDSHVPLIERKRVALYIRVSSERQIENYSMATQAERLKKFCKENNWLYRIYRDAGESGFDTDRPAFKKMLFDAEMSKFELILIDRVDRICRSLYDLTQLYKYLSQLGVGIKSISEPIDTTIPMGKYFLYQLGLFAEMERDWFRERSKKGREARAKEGKWKGGSTGYGYRYARESGRLVIDESEAKVVKLIFEKYLEFESLKRVAGYLNDEGIPTRNGRKWQATTIGNILERETYIGVLRQGDIEVRLEELRIIEDDFFQAVKELKEERRKFAPHRKRGNKIYVGEKFCFNCGAMLFEEMRYCSECGLRQERIAT